MNAHRCGWGEPYPCCGDGDRVRGTANPAEESDDFADQWIRPYVTARAESGEAGAADTLRLSKVQFAEPSGDAVFIVMHGSTSTVTVSMSRPQPVRHAAPRYRPRLVTAVATVVGTLVVAAAAWHSSDETSSRGPDPSTALEVVEPGDEATEKTADSTTTPRLPPPPAPGGVSATATPQRSAQARPTGSAEAGKSPNATGSASSARDSAPAAPPPSRTPVPPATAKPPAVQPVLRRGDRGVAVNDLQSRLSQLGLYDGPIHGQYNGPVSRAVSALQDRYGITGDERAVYGRATRAALEARTT